MPLCRHPTPANHAEGSAGLAGYVQQHYVEQGRLVRRTRHPRLTRTKRCPTTCWSFKRIAVAEGGRSADDPAVAAQRQQQRQQGLIAGLVTLPFLLRRAVRRVAAVHPDRMRRHALLLARVLATRAGHAAPRAGSALHAFHAQRAGAGAGAHRAPAGRQNTDWLFVKAALTEAATPGAGHAGSHRPTKDFRYYIGLVYVNVRLPDRGGLHDALVFPPCGFAGAVPDPAAVLLMAAFNGWWTAWCAGTSAHASARARAASRVHLSPRQASLIPLAVLASRG